MIPTTADALLMLSIAGAPYAVTPLWEGQGAARSFGLRSGSGEEYTVLRDGFGRISCTCPAARHRPQSGTCKHARALVAVRLLDPPAGVAYRTESHRPSEATPCPSQGNPSPTSLAPRSD